MSCGGAAEAHKSMQAAAWGVPTEAREALVFALLAWWHHRGHPGNVPAVTGACRETVLGTRVEPA